MRTIRASICAVSLVAVCTASSVPAFGVGGADTHTVSPIDAGLEMAITPVASPEGIIDPTCSGNCDQVGGTDAGYSGLNRYRANVFRMTESAQLKQIQMELVFFGQADLFFSVHEDCDGDGVFTRIQPDSELLKDGNETNDFTPWFYCSETFDPPITLQAGCDYAIGVSWSENVGFLIDTRSYPTPNDNFADGDIQGSGGLSISPPAPDNLSFAIYRGGAYSMQLCLTAKPGACCIQLPDGTHECRDLTSLVCSTSGGAFTEERFTCADLAAEGSTCPLAVGGCCLPDGNCSPLDRFSCANNNGVWHEELCATDPCPPRGACCLDNGDCAIMTAAACEDPLRGNGVYQGDGKTCLELEGACHLGACCAGGSCLVVTESTCANIPGIWQAHGLGCDAGVCSAPGACCLDSGTSDCLDGADRMNATECTAAGGSFQGDYSACGYPVGCNRGACCTASFGCQDNLLASSCTSSPINGVFRGVGTTCDTLNPSCDTGYCCWNGNCLTDLEPRACSDFPGGYFFSLASACTGACVLNPAVGQCCLGDGSCVPTLDQNTCESDLGGTWTDTGGQGCAGSACPLPQTSACCLPDGQCAELSSADCGRAGGAFHDGVACSLELCTHGACCQPTGACADQDDSGGPMTIDACTTGAFFAGRNCTDNNACPQPGACCLPDGSCQSLLKGLCELSGGLFHGSETVCDAAINCTRGACCQFNGICLVTTEDFCDDPANFTAGLACVDANCDPAEACCLTDPADPSITSCEDLTVAYCEAPEQGGKSQGPGTVCTDDSCTEGACCKPDGSCVDDVTIANCAGTHQGVGTLCADVADACTAGACCLAGGTCEDGVTVGNCAGTHMGAGSVCNADICTGGACCLPDGTCNDDVTIANCAGTHQGIDSLCGDGDICTGGACCRSDGTCEDDITAGNCTGTDVHQGAGSTCAAAACGRGVCCGHDGTCRPDVVPSQCAGDTGNFVAGGECTTCPLAGACCFDTGSCSQLTASECANRGGLHLGDGIRCDTDAGACPGACCFSPYTCMVATAEECGAISAEFSAGAECTAIACGGACCRADGSCDFVLEADCDVAGGDLFMLGTDCGEAVCPGRGACCPADPQAPCDETTPDVCASAGGSYRGNATVCTVGMCDRGGCCHTDGTCDDNALRSECTGQYDTFNTLGCGNFACNARAACCVAGEPCALLTQAECGAIQGAEFAAPGTLCGDNDSACAEVACCLSFNKVCDIQSRAVCERDGGTVLSETPVPVCETFCEVGGNRCTGEDDCAPADTCVSLACSRGACCSRDGDCRNDVYSFECQGVAEVFSIRQSCFGANYVCEPKSACCLPDGTCELLSHAECVDANGLFSENVRDCGADLCEVGACCKSDGSCTAVETGQVCEQFGWSFQGAGTVCPADNTCRACCNRVDGTCTDTVEDACLLAGGEFDAAAVCADGVCAGACCLPDGTCADETASACANQGGHFDPTGECTGEVPDPNCPPFGACCTDGLCEVKDAVDCTGTYLGDGSLCDAGVCALGACCDSEGLCTKSLPSECVDTGSRFRPGVTCGVIDCNAVGACCVAGSCQSDMTAAECGRSGGVYQGDLTSCVDNLCDLGSCCAADGGCLDGVVASECTAPGESFAAGGDCATAACVPTGACCAAGSCSEFVTQVDCEQSGGVYQGDATTCDADLCTLGRCCAADGSCLDGVVAGQCAAPGDSFLASTDCATDPCVSTGACCSSGSCNESVTQVSCETSGGVYQGDATTCDADLCTLGRCCATDGSCLDGVVAGQCAAPGDSFLGGTDCATDPCVTTCGMADVVGVVFADADGVPAESFDQPGNCAIDARRPHDPSDPLLKEGWDRMVLSFSCDPTVMNLVPADFAVSVTPAAPPAAPTVASVVADSLTNTVTVTLDAPISPVQWTCIAHPASSTKWCMGFLPGDVGQDLLTNSSDIGALINSINNVPGLVRPGYATDIDRSGLTTPTDILREIDLLNGAGQFDPWITKSLPPCPTAP